MDFIETSVEEIGHVHEVFEVQLIVLLLTEIGEQPGNGDVLCGDFFVDLPEVDFGLFFLNGAGSLFVDVLESLIDE